MSFIYKYKTSTLTHFLKPQAMLKLAVQNVFYTEIVLVIGYAKS